MTSRKRKILLAVIFCFAFAMRFQNLAWDELLHLHPDERFLTMVGNAMSIPSSVSHYLSPDTSTFNPANVGYPFFVYGTLPVVVSKLLTVVTHLDTFDGFVMRGRFLSAFADMGALAMVMLFAAAVTRKNGFHGTIPYAAGFLYAGFVLPIQSAHFFISDSFLSFAVMSAVLFAYRFGSAADSDRRLRDILLAALATAGAVAVKVTGVFVLPLVLYLMFLYPMFLFPGKQRKGTVVRLVFSSALFALTAYYLLRIMAPYYFQAGNIIDPTPSRLFIANIRSLKALDGMEGWFPPAIQWMHTMPFFFPLANLAFLGLGLPAFALTVMGMGMVLFPALKPDAARKDKKHMYVRTFVPIVIWVSGVFLYFSVQFVKVMRYFLFLYPFFALFAALAFDSILRTFREQRGRMTAAVVMLLALVAWPLLFSTIYWTENTRAAASRWIYRNIPAGSLLLGEYWDDPLPMPVLHDPSVQYRSELLHVFDPDTREKWAAMDTLLTRGDYYILSSNRGWGSVPTVPAKYPRMSQFYDELLAGKTSYHIVKEFIPWYQRILFFGRVPILSDWMDESFTVYDHPTVIIMKNGK